LSGNGNYTILYKISFIAQKTGCGEDGVCAGNVVPVIESIVINGETYTGTPVILLENTAEVVVTVSKPEAELIITGGNASVEQTGNTFNITLGTDGSYHFGLILSDGCQMDVENFAVRSAVKCAGDITINNETQLDAIKECETIEGFLRITNYAADTFELENLMSVQGVFYINNNSTLTSFSLPNFKVSGGEYFYIDDNPELPTQTALDLADQTTIGGTTTISGNKP